MSFAKYVSFSTVYRATFNYYEPSFVIEKEGKRYRVHHAKHPLKPEPNLVVLYAYDDPEELYFRAFLGKSSGECETESEAQPFFDEIRKTIDPKFRVKGKDLEKRILLVLEELEQGRFSVLPQ